jgi:hypothetical protein
MLTIGPGISQNVFVLASYLLCLLTASSLLLLLLLLLLPCRCRNMCCTS